MFDNITGGDYSLMLLQTVPNRNKQLPLLFGFLGINMF